MAVFAVLTRKNNVLEGGTEKIYVNSDQVTAVVRATDGRGGTLISFAGSDDNRIRVEEPAEVVVNKLTG